MTFTLDINSVRHIDLFTELRIEEEKYGRLYLPKLYLDINARRIAEIEGFYFDFISMNLIYFIRRNKQDVKHSFMKFTSISMFFKRNECVGVSLKNA